METLNWRASQHMRKTFLADISPQRDVILFRSLEPYWAWAVRDHAQEPMKILAEGKHRSRVVAAEQAKAACAFLFARPVTP